MLIGFVFQALQRQVSVLWILTRLPTTTTGGSIDGTFTLTPDNGANAMFIGHGLSPFAASVASRVEKHSPIS